MEQLAPLYLAEDWDNVGLIIGDPDQEIKRILVCLDITPQTLDMAVKNNVDLIISHHPLIFKSFKKILTTDHTGMLIHKLIQNNISVYAAHTNLDFAKQGVNQTLAEVLDLQKIENLKTYKPQSIYKIAVFAPAEHADIVRNTMSLNGAGHIGNYSDCSFMTDGTGTFKPLEGSNPYIGTQNSLEHVSEIKIEMIVPEDKLNSVITTMKENHPYEEVAYDVYKLEIKQNLYGMGKVGLLPKAFSFNEFISFVKHKLNVENVRVIRPFASKINTVGVFCGSFDPSLLSDIKNKVDVLITGDVKYHTALDIMQSGPCVIDAGHFYTEKAIVPKLAAMLREKFPNIVVFEDNSSPDPFMTF